MDKELKFIGYCRKSSDREDKQVLSIGSQKTGLGEMIIKDNLGKVELLAENKSAYKIGRPEFGGMIEKIERGEINAILTWHLTRLARNSQDGGKIIYMMDEGLIREIRTPERVYRNTTDDKFLMQIHFAMAKKSSDDTSDFVKRDIKAKLKKGEYPDFAPFGYINIDKEGKISGKQYTLEKQIALGKMGRPLKRVEQDPELALLIKKLFELSSTGRYTLDMLRDESFKWGLTGRRSSKKISKQTLHRILTNPFYYGAILWRKKLLEPEELPEETRHDPIVTKELYDRVQEVLGLRSRPIGTKKFYSYSNIIKCGVCGGNISGLMVKGHTYYRCCKCIGRSYTREEDIEAQIIEVLNSLTIDDDFYKLAMEEINKANEKEVSNRDEIKKQQFRELDRCQIRLDNLLKLKISPDNKNGDLLSDEEFGEEKRDTLSQMRGIREKIADFEQKNSNWFDQCVNYVNFTKNLYSKFEDADPEDKRDIFQFVFHNPTITDKILVNQGKNPHNFIISFNEEKQSTITTKNRLNKTKTRVLTPVSDNWRTGRDSNSQLPP